MATATAATRRSGPPPDVTPAGEATSAAPRRGSGCGGKTSPCGETQHVRSAIGAINAKPHFWHDLRGTLRDILPTDYLCCRSLPLYVTKDS